MKPKIRKWKRNVLLCAGSALLLAAPAFAAAHETRQLAAGEKATVGEPTVGMSTDGLGCGRLNRLAA